MKVLLFTALLLAPLGMPGAAPPPPTVDLRPSLRPTPVNDVAAGSVRIEGHAEVTDGAPVRLRVTTSFGQTFDARVFAREHRFACRFPQDFAHAPALSPLLLYVDGTDADEFGGPAMISHQGEIVLIVSGNSTASLPDLPLAFTEDFVDASGRKDAESAQWPAQRALVNLFMHSRATKLTGIGRGDFDLSQPSDFAWFKDHVALYDFDHRDRDWSQPLGHRVARGFWQAVWNTWFNASNDHPWDGNPANTSQKNYRPYTFANDAADLLVLYQMRRVVPPRAADNRVALVNEVLANLLAMQQRGRDNFALAEASGKREQYTAGAFHYGMFETGEWLTEGKGWFARPTFRDFVRGGVFNGRCLWALGESIKADPRGPLAAAIREAIPLTLRFCLHDGLPRGYTQLTKAGHPVWGGPAGEHAYLLLGMLAAAEVAPGLPVTLAEDQAARPLQALCVDALDALIEIADADGTWSRYANADAMNIAALAEGARVFSTQPGAARWIAAAARAADVWLALRPLPAERTAPTPMLGQREGNGMTFRVNKREAAHLPLYIGGHWLHALAVLHSVTHEPRYANRARALLAYYCGDNPLCVRLLNELGSVNNRVTDTDADGIEDRLNWDAYPESSAFVQIGLLHLLKP